MRSVALSPIVTTVHQADFPGVRRGGMLRDWRPSPLTLSPLTIGSRAATPSSPATSLQTHSFKVLRTDRIYPRPPPPTPTHASTVDRLPPFSQLDLAKAIEAWAKPGDKRGKIDLPKPVAKRRRQEPVEVMDVDTTWVE